MATMMTAYMRALGQLTDTRILRTLAVVVTLSLIVFLGLWFGVTWLIEWETLTEITGVATVLKLLGSFATIVIAFFLFPVVITLFLGFFLESIAAAVEVKHYPDLAKPKGIGVVSGVYASLLFLLKAIVVNLLLLVLLVVPPVYPFAWFLGNGYLIGREYFELVAFRRLSRSDAKILRARHRWTLMFGGFGGVALFALPVINLIAPVILTMVMVHCTERWRSKVV